MKKSSLEYASDIIKCPARTPFSSYMSEWPRTSSRYTLRLFRSLPYWDWLAWKICCIFHILSHVIHTNSTIDEIDILSRILMKIVTFFFMSLHLAQGFLQIALEIPVALRIVTFGMSILWLLSMKIRYRLFQLWSLTKDKVTSWALNTAEVEDYGWEARIAEYKVYIRKRVFERRLRDLATWV